jgi:hypothetical protein
VTFRLATGLGRVFEIAKTAGGGYATTPTNLVSFNGGTGQWPTAGLIADAGGNLLGTTNGGAASEATRYGTVFELAASGFVPPAVRKWLAAGVLQEGPKDRDGGVDAARRGNFAAACEYLPALRLRSLGSSMAATSIHGRYDCRSYADNMIVSFEHQDDAERFLEDLSARMADFELGLHPEKTRLIEFGRKAIASRRARGLGKPETFDFLGLTHYCATRRSGGGFVLGRTPVRKRMRANLRQIKEQLKATRHDGVEAQGKWLAQMLRGWLACYALPMSAPAVAVEPSGLWHTGPYRSRQPLRV